MADVSMTRNHDRLETAAETRPRPSWRRVRSGVTRAVAAFVIGSILVASVVGSAAPATGQPAASGSTPGAGQIQYAPASVSITAVGPTDNDTDVERPATDTTLRPNETTVVRGETNLRPDDNAVLVELRTENGTVLAANATDEWGTDGAWSTTVNTSGLRPDTYVLEVEAAGNTDRVDVEVSPGGDRSTATTENQSTTTTENQDRSTTAAETNASTADGGATDPVGENESADAVRDESTDSAETGASAPGFGFLVAAVAILALGAVASMRRG
jgi:hypothetical protein